MLISAQSSISTNKFRNEIHLALQKSPKQLPSKYFYDQKGDALFQQIMALPEYYLTERELDIFKSNSGALSDTMLTDGNEFDLIELGAGDASKSVLLLEELQSRNARITYIPIDISGNVLSILSEKIQSQMPGLDITCIAGEYIDGLKQAVQMSNRRKVILFLGSNIGNMEPEEAMQFCRELRNHLQPSDIILMGFDLKKHPQTILDAYNDKSGITAAFNLNLLSRINSELNGNFILENFEHYASYDPITGACKSYLVSLLKQEVTIDGLNVNFDLNEIIYMELSQKFSIGEIENLAEATGFRKVSHITNSNGWFVDSFWQAI